jgi:hypothetical protein
VKSAAGIVSALLLSVSTIAVFAVLQDVGPESALRKFHVAAVNGDFRRANEVCEPGSNEEYVRFLQRSVAQVARAGGRYEVRQVLRRRTVAQALVVYSFPFRSQEIPQIWVLKKSQGRWYIQPKETVSQRMPTQSAGQNSAPMN